MEPKVEYTVPAFTQPFEGSQLYKECAAPSLSAAIDAVATAEQRAAMPKSELSEMLMTLASRVAFATHRQPPTLEEISALVRLPAELKTAENIAVLAAEASPDDAFVAYRLAHVQGQDRMEHASAIDEVFVPQYLAHADLLALRMCAAFVESECYVLNSDMKILGETKTVGAWLERLLSLDEHSPTALALAHSVLVACRDRQDALREQRICALKAKQRTTRDDRVKATLETTIMMEQQKSSERPSVAINGASFNALQILARLLQVQQLKQLYFGDAVPVSLFPTTAFVPTDIPTSSAERNGTLCKFVTEFTRTEALQLALPRRAPDGSVEFGPPVLMTERSVLCELLESEKSNVSLWMCLLANLHASTADGSGEQSVLIGGECVTPITCATKICGIDPTTDQHWKALLQLMRAEFAKENSLTDDDAAQLDPRCELHTATVNGVALTARTVSLLANRPAKNPQHFRTFLGQVEAQQDQHLKEVKQKALLHTVKRITLFTTGLIAVGVIGVAASKLFKR